MRVAVIGGGGMARVVLALRYLIAKAAERMLDCSSEAMEAIAAMKIVAMANAVDDGPSTKVLRKKYHVPGYFADVADTLGAFCPDPLLVELFRTRLQQEIGGQLMRDLLFIAWKELAGKYGWPQVREVLDLIDDGNAGNKQAWTLLLGAGRYRFEADGFTGHSLRNLFHFALERAARPIASSRRDAQRMALNALNLAYKVPPQHRVIAATWASAVVQAETKEGEVITGQNEISLRGLKEAYPQEISKLYLVPPVKASPEAKEAVLCADKVIISCGDTLSTLVPALLAGGIREAILESSAEIIYVAPQITRRGETLFYDEPYTVEDLIGWIEKAIGRHPHRIIYDRTEIPGEVLKRYPGEKKIRLGRVPTYAVSSRHERAMIIKGYFGVEDPDGRWVHDPEALALQGFLPIFSDVWVGALS